MTDERPKTDLPKAFTTDDPAEDGSSDRVGAGRVVDGEPPTERAVAADDQQVEEASEESFPGSDATPFRGTPQE